MTFSRIKKDFQETFSITELEANELYQKSQNLSKSFVDLRNAYSTDHLIESREYAPKKEAIEKKTGFRKLLGQAKTRLSKNAKNMWQAHIAIKKAYDEFSAVCRAHGISGGVETIITSTFEIRNERGDLNSPEMIIEGRRVFDTLRSEYQLQDRLGY